MMARPDANQVIRESAQRLGFDRVGMARAEPIRRAGFVAEWLERGYGGTMHYLNRAERSDPRNILAGAKSVIVLALNYHHQAPPTAPADGPTGRVAMYAWGKDYHRVIKTKLWRLIDALRDTIDDPFDARPCVDTAPIIERELAAAAGLGWIGKNTMVLNSELGSYFFLAAIVTTLELTPDTPVVDHCGSCRRCLDACPTDAFVEPYVMDASRCISYLTIEHRGSIEPSLRAQMGDWVFGCDVCQDVCPFNGSSPTAGEPAFAPRDGAARPALRSLLDPESDAASSLRRGSAATRAKPDMLRRNAAVAMGNAGGPDDAPHLNRAAESADPMIAEHARWAVDRLASRVVDRS